MLKNSALKSAFTSSEIESAFVAACGRSKTRAGRLENNQALEAVATRDENLKKAIFMMAADVADDGQIASEEDAVLGKIASILGLDKARLLADA
jgi:tellurite resistance protein